MKYIVKNCPSYHTFYPDTGAEPFSMCDTKLPYKKCQDCTDCVIKKVINRLITLRDTAYWIATAINADQVLKLFNIQEVEE